MPGFELPIGSDETIRHIPKFMGNIWYVSNTCGSDTANTGTTPNDAYATITKAHTECSAGDAISISAGTYTENVVISKNSVELWAEIGAIIVGSAGTPLTISGNYCKVVCSYGTLRLNPIANGTGLVASGNWNYIHNIRVPGGSSADLGFDITGDGCVLTDCRCSDPLIAAFKVQGNKNKLQDCITGGTPANTSIGFWLTSSCDKPRLVNCSSQGHASGGFVVDTGVTNGDTLNCASGGGDGVKSDSTHAVVWSNYTFDNIVTKEITFVGGSPGGVNLFKVSGIVEIEYIYGQVATVFHADVGNLKLEIFDGGASDLTTVTAVGAAPVDSFVGKTADITTAITYKSSAAAYIVENSNYRDPQVVFIIGAKTGVDTYIRCNVSGVATSGAIEFHIKYKPLSDTGFVEGV